MVPSKRAAPASVVAGFSITAWEKVKPSVSAGLTSMADPASTWPLT